MYAFNSPQPPPAYPSVHGYPASHASCRICGAGFADRPRTDPCRCSGSVGSVHADCLSERVKNTRVTKCEVCHTDYTISRRLRSYDQWTLVWVPYERKHIVAAVCLTAILLVGVLMMASPGGLQARRDQWRSTRVQTETHLGLLKGLHERARVRLLDSLLDLCEADTATDCMALLSNTLTDDWSGEAVRMVATNQPKVVAVAKMVDSIWKENESKQQTQSQAGSKETQAQVLFIFVAFLSAISACLLFVLCSYFTFIIAKQWVQENMMFVIKNHPTK